MHVKTTLLIIDNKIEKTVSGPAIFIGVASFIVGIVSLITSHWIAGAIGIIIACFLFFSYSGIQINTQKRIVKPYNCWFGIYKTGKWKTLETYTGLTLVPMKRGYTVYSRSNRSVTSEETEFRVYLLNKAHKPALAIKRCKKREEAQNSMDEFSIWLHFPVYTKK